MPQEIGWSVEAKLLYQIKQLTRQLTGRQYIVSFPNFASFPNPGITGTLYVDEATGDIYVWNGTNYVLLSSGITAINGLIAAAQLLVTGSTGTDFNISSVGTTHTFNIPTASATNRGLLSNTDWTTFNSKIGGTGTTNYVSKFTGAGTLGNSQFLDNGTTVTALGSGEAEKLVAQGSILVQADNNHLSVDGAGSSRLGIAKKSGSAPVFAAGSATPMQFGHWSTTNISGNVTSGTYSERMRITAAGRLLVGTTTEGTNTVDIAGSLRTTTGANFATTSGDVLIGATQSYPQNIGGSSNYGSKLQFNQNSWDGSVSFTNWTNAAGANAFGTPIFFSKAKSGSVGTHGIVGFNDVLGNFVFNGSDGAAFQTAAQIRVSIDSTPSVGDMPGRIEFFTTPNGTVTPTERMRITSAGNVGIGTTSPAHTLDVTGTAMVTQSAYFATVSGNVGVGTASPASRLHVQRDGNDLSVLRVTNAGAGGSARAAVHFFNDVSGASGAGFIGAHGSNTGAGIGLPNQIVLQSNTSGGLTLIGSDAAGIIRFFTGSTASANERMRITAAGNVGIGTASPVSNIHVSGASQVYFTQSSQDNALDEKNWMWQTGLAVGAGVYRLRAVDDPFTTGQNAYIVTRTGIAVQMHQWLTSNSERMRITSGGNVLIGTTTDGGQRLQSVGDTRLDGNLGIFQGTFGSSATRTLAISSGTAPASSPADCFQLYSADIVAGNAAPHFRTENGAVVKIYQETTGVGAAAFSQVAGGASDIVYQDSTFDGYTLKQIVKALRNQGLLA